MIPKFIESIICDACGSEMIKHTSYPALYAIEVRPIDINRNNTSITHLSGPIEPETTHFCDNKCLMDWIHKNY